jgi:hypothetical protein
MATDEQISEAKILAQLYVSQLVLARNHNLPPLSEEERMHLMDASFSRNLHNIKLRDSAGNEGFPWGPVIAVGGALLILGFMAWIKYFL